MKAPFGWFGGKGRNKRRILPYLPSHAQYVEPFFGAGAIFFAKEPCPHETINDLDHGVMNLFTVLRDHPEEFQRLVELTIHSRELYTECRDKWAQEEDPVRKAWRWWVVAVDSFGGSFGSAWRVNGNHVRRGMVSDCSAILSCIHSLPAAAARLRITQIECGPALRVLERYCTPDSLAYCDPPYIPDARRDGTYANEMTAADHEALVAALLCLPGRFLVSGYAHPIYAPLEAAGWGRVDWEVDASSAGRTRASGLQGPGSCAHQRRTETLWLDPATAAEVLPAAQTALALEDVAG